MKKLLTLLMLLALAIPQALAGEKTITISRNDVDWESANTVYNITKGGVELVMSGGMNNPNFLLMKQQTYMTIKSYNYNIKKVVFHCLDNTNVAAGDETFYNGPQTMDVAKNTTLNTIPGKYSSPYNGNTYDGYWSSTYTGTLSGHTSYADGFPAGYELMFTNGPRPIRFASIDIVLEQDKGDLYELVTNNSQLRTNVDYMLVGRTDASTLKGRAMSINNSDPSNPATGNIKSTEVDLVDNGFRVRTNDEVQYINLVSSGDSNFPWRLSVSPSQSIRSGSSETTGTSYNNGYQLIVQNNPGANSSNRYYFFTSININGNESSSNYEHDAVIKYYNINPYSTTGGHDYTNCQIRHNNDNNYFRNIANNTSIRQNVFLYKPAVQYTVTTEVQPDDAHGSISLRDGVLVDNGTNWSQEMETVQFLVTPAIGKKIVSVTIAYDDDETTTITPLTVSPSINGTLYTFEMPGHNVHITAVFEDVVYHNIYTVVQPNGDYGNIFLTEGYVVQQDQVKSYDGETVVFNVTPNLIDIEDESKGYHELYSVVVTNKTTGEEIPYTYSDGNYSFTMPNDSVTITATFIYNTDNPLYLLGTANGGTWAPTGPRFNYDPVENQYFIDVYFKGDSGNYGDYTGGNLPEVSNGHFNVVWGKWSSWSDVNSGGRRGLPYDWDYYITENNPTYTLVYDDWRADQGYAFKIPAGVYRIYVKSYGYHNDVLTIVKQPAHLTLDPMGGETAAEAVQVSKDTEVTLSGDIYNKIMAINPDEPAANFKYLAVKNGTADAPVASTTTASTTLTEINAGETVTELRGYNYLGWIVAGDTAYFKVIETPLAWIEENGVPGKTYTVADKLLIVWTPEEHADNPCADYGKTFWAKDLPTTEKPGGLSIDATSPKDGQVDYMMLNEYTARPDGWDQSNWIELDLSDVPDHGAAIGKYIAAGTLKGEYTSDLNYKMKVTSLEFTDEEDEYVPNTFCTANFLENNLMLTPESTGPQGPSGNYYFFLNPKVQEYARITYAKWDKDNQEFVVPSFGNAGGFSGALKIGGWGYNIKNGEEVITALDNNAIDPSVDPNLEYEFRAIIHRENYNYGHNPNASVGTREQQSSNNITVWPIDLQATSNVITAVNDVNANKTVSNVKYYNITGIESDKPFSGVNIVVTRYTDGSYSTSKVLR